MTGSCYLIQKRFIQHNPSQPFNSLVASIYIENIIEDLIECPILKAITLNLGNGWDIAHLIQHL